MLGEQIGEELGRITARRVLPSDEYGPKVEVTFEASGKVLGSAPVGDTSPSRAA
jgi:hypothetical protein